MHTSHREVAVWAARALSVSRAEVSVWVGGAVMLVPERRWAAIVVSGAGRDDPFRLEWSGFRPVRARNFRAGFVVQRMTGGGGRRFVVSVSFPKPTELPDERDAVDAVMDAIGRPSRLDVDDVTVVPVGTIEGLPVGRPIRARVPDFIASRIRDSLAGIVSGATVFGPSLPSLPLSPLFPVPIGDVPATEDDSLEIDDTIAWVFDVRVLTVDLFLRPLSEIPKKRPDGRR